MCPKYSVVSDYQIMKRVLKLKTLLPKINAGSNRLGQGLTHVMHEDENNFVYVPLFVFYF